MKSILVWYTEDVFIEQAYFFLIQYTSHALDAISPQVLI